MTSISPSPIIEYATGTVAFPHRYQRLALAASLPSLIVPFAPFVWDVSPWSAAQTLLNPDDFFDTLVIGLLGIGFFAAPTTFAWRRLPDALPTGSHGPARTCAIGRSRRCRAPRMRA